MIDRSYFLAPERGLDAPRIRRELARDVGRVLSGAMESDAAAPRLARVEVDLAAIDPFHWLQAHPSAAKVFWSGREAEVSTAALGVADEVAEADGASGLDALVRRLADAPAGVRYFGGTRFDVKAAPDADWSAFGAYRFILPRFELAAGAERTSLACNLVLPRDVALRPQILAEIRHLRFPMEPLAGSLPLPIARTDEPGRDGWMENVRWALDAFANDSLDKVVLARKVAFGFPEPLDPLVLLKQLKAATPGCHHFYVQPAGSEAAFLGASPERLFLREGREVLSEAVAGTRPRGRSASDDDRLRDELLHSEKDLREHEYVRRSIEAALAVLCDHVYADEHPTEMMLTRGRHLFTAARGTLRPQITDADVLRALHPTPAVGGYPRTEAMDAIRTLEPFDRGWYAGPVGWVGVGGAEFAVAIRSGLVRGRRLSLFSGAGIVAGSVPESEHAEVEQKISDFVKVLDLDNGRA